jgi:hypothetical protein
MLEKKAVMEALNGAAPYRSLRLIVEAALSHGCDREELTRELEDLRPELAPAQEDVVLDVMDCIVGWCAPAERIERRVS